jgi:hypothetical protein
MAEEKEKPASGFWDHPDPFVRVVWMILAGLAILYIVNGFIRMIMYGDIFSPGILHRLYVVYIEPLIPFLKIISIIISLFLVYEAIYFWRLLTRLYENERKLLYPEAEPTVAVVNPGWQRIVDHVESQNENDWRQAIIEADIMLDDLLDKLSLPGETMAEKLKAVEKSDFLTLDNAWEAHKIRNQIAHEGAQYMLTQREARRVIELYRSIFDEFKMI